MSIHNNTFIILERVSIKSSCHVPACLCGMDRNSFKVKLSALSLSFVGSADIPSAKIKHL